MKTDKKIEKLRKKIDVFDDQLLDILFQRFSVVKKIGQIKSDSELDIQYLDREKEIIDRLSDKLNGKLNRKEIIEILEPIFNISKKIQGSV